MGGLVATGLVYLVLSLMIRFGLAGLVGILLNLVLPKDGAEKK